MSEAPSAAAGGSLKKDALGLVGAATLGMVMLSPAMTLYGGFGPSFLAAGRAAPLAFIWAFLAIIPTAISYALLSREYPDSGSAASWTHRALGGRVSRWASWMIFLYYFTNFAIQPVTLGVFAGDALARLGMPSGALTYFLGVAVCVAVSAWIVYRGITVSMKGALVFLLIEAAVVGGLCFTIMSNAPTGAAGLEGFHVTASPAGAGGIFQAMIFGILAYCGFDVVSTLAEETRLARRLIPQATLACLVLYAVFIVTGIWCLTYGGDVTSIEQAAKGNQMPIAWVAEKFWGKGAILVTATAISASLGLGIATSVGASRILFWMGREGLADRRFSALHPQSRAPWRALHPVFLFGTLGAILAGIFLGPYDAYVWWCSTSTFFAMLTFLLVNVANLVLFRERAFRSVKGFALHLLLPVAAIATNGYILYRSFFVELMGQPWLTGKSVVVADVVVAAAVSLIVWLRPAPLASVASGLAALPADK